MANLFGGIWRFCLTLLAVLFLFLVIALGSIKATVFNQTYMTQQLTQSGISAKIQNQLTQQVEAYGRENNIPSDALANVVPQDLVEKNLTSYLSSLYTGTEFQLTGEDELTANVTQAVTQYTSQSGVSANVLAAETQTISQTISDSVTQSINDQPITQYAEKIAKYQSTVTFGLLVVSGAFLVVFLLLLWATRGAAKKLRGTSRVIGFASLLTFGVYWGADFINLPHYVTTSEESVRQLVEQFTTSFLGIFGKIGIAGMGIAVFLFLISLMPRRKK